MPAANGWNEFDWQPHIHSKDKRRNLVNCFKNNKGPFSANRVSVVRQIIDPTTAEA